MEKTFDDFIEKYDPMEHPTGEFGTHMFDTHKESDINFVRSQIKFNKVWTVIDGEGQDLYVIPGYHFVNRMGYIISNIPYEENCEEEYVY